MSDSRLNKTGLEYFYNRIKNIFATKTAVETLENTVQDLVTEGGEPNVIETVKRNGTALTVTDKAVDITVPTKTSDLTNDGNGSDYYVTTNDIDAAITDSINGTDVASLATKGYVNTNGGKIDKIKVNGTEQTITNKEVDITVPTAVSGLTNDSGYQTASEVATAIQTAIAATQHLTKSVVDTLPATGEENVLYLVPDDNGGTNKDMYLWNGTAFVLIGNTETDLTGYWNETNLPAITTAEIDEIIDGE